MVALGRSGGGLRRTGFAPRPRGRRRRGGGLPVAQGFGAQPGGGGQFGVGRLACAIDQGGFGPAQPATMSRGAQRIEQLGQGKEGSARQANRPPASCRRWRRSGSAGLRGGCLRSRGRRSTCASGRHSSTPSEAAASDTTARGTAARSGRPRAAFRPPWHRRHST
jgi:hypothetical protein